VSENNPDTSAETFQVNTTPVQAFTTPVVPPDSVIRIRQGRPSRVAPAKSRESGEVAGIAQVVPLPSAEPAKSAGPPEE